jgi:hypothetical protein
MRTPSGRFALSPEIAAAAALLAPNGGEQINDVCLFIYGGYIII